MTDPPLSNQRHPPQFSLTVMLMLVLVSALLSAGLIHMARIPEVQEDWSMLFGTEVTADRTHRGPQILFIMFTFTSPLLLAMFLSLAMGVWTKLTNR